MATTLFQGTPVALAGEFIQKGVQAPDFSLVKGDLSTFSLADAKGKFVVLNIFPSMDTGVCAASVRKFNKLAAGKYVGTGYFERPSVCTRTFLHGRRNRTRYSSV